MSEFVVWFDSSETGAPVLNNAAGSMIGVLDACLVTGFNTKPVTSITIAGGIATANCTGHGYSSVYSKDVQIGGATPAGLNGRKQITVVNANTFTFATTDSGAVTGTITAKRDPLGWTKEFTGINKAVYKRSDLTATQIRLRVDDTNTGIALPNAARAISIEGPTDVDTFSQKAPAQGVIPGGYFWNKGADSASAKHWLLVGDSKLFYLITQGGANTFPFSTPNGYASGVMAFGDLDSFKPGDAYGSFISGESANSSGEGTQTPANGVFSSGAYAPGLPGGFTYSRAFSQLGEPSAGGCLGFSRQPSGDPGNQFVFPSPIDSGYVVSAQVLATESVPGGNSLRGLVPGVVEILGQRAIEHREVVGDLLGLSGRKIVGVRSYSAGLVRGAFDITGPWR